MRLLRIVPLIVSAAILTGGAQAQYYPAPWPGPYARPYPPRPRQPEPPHAPSLFHFGGFLGLGLESHDTAAQTTAVAVPLGGLFFDVGQHAIRGGIDFRGQGGTEGQGVRGTLVGPRVSANLAFFHSYAAVLFGPNHYETQPAQMAVFGTPAPGTDKHGMTTKAAVGLELDIPNTPFSWRVLEFTTGSFNGIADSHPQTFSTGIVVRIP